MLAILFASVLLITVSLWGLRFRHGLYLLPIALGLLVRLGLLYLYETEAVLGNLDILDYQPELEAFRTLRASGDSLAPFLDIHVSAYTLLYPGWIYSTFGEPGLWLIRLANACIGLLILAPLVSMYEDLFSRRLPQLGAALLLLWPTWLTFNLEIGRTSPTVLFAVATIPVAMRVVRNPTLRTWVPIALLAGITFLLRVHYVAYSAVLVVLGTGTLRRGWPRRALYSAALGIGAVWAYMAATQLDSAQALTAFVLGRERGGSVYLTGVYPSNPWDWAWYLPLHGFYFLFSPMPWTALSASDLYTAATSVVAWSVLFLATVALWAGRERLKDPLLKILLVTLLVVSVSFGAVTKNAGAAVRYRLPTTLLLVTTSVGLLTPRKRVAQTLPARQRHELCV